MTTRIAVISIIVEKEGASEDVNRLLHDFSQYIVGRLGIPYRKRELNVIVIVVEAPVDVVSALTGKLGLLRGVSAKTIFSKKEFSSDEDSCFFPR